MQEPLTGSLSCGLSFDTHQLLAGMAHPTITRHWNWGAVVAYVLMLAALVRLSSQLPASRANFEEFHLFNEGLRMRE